MDLDLLYKLTRGYNKKYPNGNDPFMITTRLLEEAGELAKEVNHHEKTGVKIQKYGPPSKEAMAKEMHDVLRSVLALTVYYDLEKELEDNIVKTFERFKKDGFIEE